MQEKRLELKITHTKYVMMWNGINSPKRALGMAAWLTAGSATSVWSCEPSSAPLRGLHRLPAKPSQTIWESFLKA